jgi:hypothetical protein
MLVDSSVWIAYLRGDSLIEVELLTKALEHGNLSGLQRRSCRKFCRERIAPTGSDDGIECLANCQWSSHQMLERLRVAQPTCMRGVDGRASRHVRRMTA